MIPSVCRTIADAPVLPTLHPDHLDEDAVCSYVRLMYEEQYAALEILCRPLESALRLFRRISRREERKLIALGLGTITSADAAKRAVEARPDFIVSPAFSRNVLRVAVVAGITYVPGVFTCQDVQDVLDAFEDEGLGVEVLKLCPANGVGVDYVQMLAGCFPGIRFCPTGGMSLDNLAYWRECPHVGAPMGSLFVPQELLENGNWTEVRQRLRQVRDVALSKNVEMPEASPDSGRKSGGVA